MYAVEYTPQAAKALKKLDKSTRGLIYSWIDKNLEGCDNPRRHGKGLAANLRGLWIYRIGDYRLIADISDEKVTILILNVGHRADIYDNWLF